MIPITEVIWRVWAQFNLVMNLYSPGQLWIWTEVKLLGETQLRQIQLSLSHYLHYELSMNSCFNSSLCVLNYFKSSKISSFGKDKFHQFCFQNVPYV